MWKQSDRATSRRKDQKKDNLPPLIPSLNVHTSKSQVRRKAGARSSLLVSHIGCRDPNAWPILYCFPRSNIRKFKQQHGVATTWTRYSIHRGRHPKWQFNLRHHNAISTSGRWPLNLEMCSTSPCTVLHNTTSGFVCPLKWRLINTIWLRFQSTMIRPAFFPSSAGEQLFNHLHAILSKRDKMPGSLVLL